MKLAARIVVGVLAVVAVAAVGFGALYASRIQTANSIEKLTDYDDYNLYRMQVRYDYDLDKMIANTTADNQSFIDAAVKQALPLLPVSIKAPTFGCSAFHIQETGGDHLMGRNYDFKRDTSAMLVCTAPNPSPLPRWITWVSTRPMPAPRPKLPACWHPLPAWTASMRRAFPLPC